MMSEQSEQRQIIGQLVEQARNAEKRESDANKAWARETCRASKLQQELNAIRRALVRDNAKLMWTLTDFDAAYHKVDMKELP